MSRAAIRGEKPALPAGRENKTLRKRLEKTRGSAWRSGLGGGEAGIEWPGFSVVARKEGG